MIIDLLTEKQNIIDIDNYDLASSNLVSSTYSPKSVSDIMSWKISSPSVSSATFIINAKNLNKLINIDYNLISGLGQFVSPVITTSIDMINWYELPYYNFDLNQTNYCKLLENNHYFNFSDHKIYTKEALTTAVSGARSDYIYSVYNSRTKTYDNLYNNYEFKYIKLQFSGFNASTQYPIYFTKFVINVDETFDNTEMNNIAVSNKSTMLYRSKIYDNYNFFPDLMTKFCLMMEDK